MKPKYQRIPLSALFGTEENMRKALFENMNMEQIEELKLNTEIQYN